MSEHYTDSYVETALAKLNSIRLLVTGQKHCTLTTCGCSASKLAAEIRQILG